MKANLFTVTCNKCKEDAEFVFSEAEHEIYNDGDVEIEYVNEFFFACYNCEAQEYISPNRE